MTFPCKCKLKTAAQEGTHPVDRSFTSGVELLDWDAALPTLLKDCNWPGRVSVGFGLLARNLPFEAPRLPEFRGRREGPVVAASVNPRKCQEADGRPADTPHVTAAAGPPPEGCTARRVGLACQAACDAKRSDLCLLGDLQGVIHLDAKVPHRRLKFAVAKQQLHGAQVLRASIDQRRLGSPHRVRAVVCRIKTEFLDPVLQGFGRTAAFPDAASRECGSETQSRRTSVRPA